MVALLPAALAAPAGAQLQEALTAQVQVDRDAAASQARIDEIRERTQDAAGRYAQAMADVDSLDRYNNQLQEQVRSQEDGDRVDRAAAATTSTRPTAKCSR